ncbi:MAG: type I methionyl aminopeptidase [Elusimicrobia bacterium]|nr:type I methionyl aminopeptidase [Elusimicrobiota bacterium]
MPVTTAQAVEIKSKDEIKIMREAGVILAAALEKVAEAVAPGVTTLELDKVAESEIRKRKATPAFLNYRGFPATICISINSEVVHGIPKKDRKLEAGDIVSLDLGCIWKGFYSDSAVTVPVGKVAKSETDLIEATRVSLEKGIEQMWPGKRLGDIGAAVQGHVEPKGYSVVRSFVGHGIGRALHEAPAVANYGKPGTGLRIVEGMVLAVEPMVNKGGPDVKILSDGWTAVTTDGSLSAHFEHSIAVTENGPVVLTLPG